MRSYWKRNLYVVLVVAFVGQASFSLVTPFLPYVMKSMDVDANLATWSGMAYAASFLASGIMAPVWGSMADRYGKKPQILRSGLGIAVLYALYPFAKTPLQFVVFRGITGLVSGFMPATTSLVATNTPEEHMGYALGTLQAASAAGTISGPLLGGIMVSGLGIPFTFRLSALVLAIITGLSYALLKEEVITGDRKMSVTADIKACFANRDLLVILGCLFLVQAAIQATQPTLVLYIDGIAAERGQDSALVSGTIYSVAGLGTVVGAALAARISEVPLAGAGPRTLGTAQSRWFFASLVGSALAIGVQGEFRSLLTISIFRMLFGLFTGIVTVAGNVLASQAVPRSFRGRAFGVLNGVLPLGSVTGPLLGGTLGDSLGLAYSFYASGVVFIASAWMFWAHQQSKGQKSPRSQSG